MDLISLQTHLVPYLKPVGCFIYNSSVRYPFKYAPLTSIWHRCHPLIVESAIEVRSVSNFITGTKVLRLLKSVPGFCVKPHATSLALYTSTSPFSFHFFTKVHFGSMASLPSGRSSNLHVPMPSNVANSC